MRIDWLCTHIRSSEKVTPSISSIRNEGRRMKQSEELKRFEEDLRGSEELRKRLDDVCRRIAAEGQVANDGEVMVAAAKEFGYNISIAALEQARAEAEELDPEALALIVGGVDNSGKDWCADTNYTCFAAYHAMTEDESGHGGWCWTGWHCLAATLHTEAQDHDVSCWKDYTCLAKYR